jgi:hypothetical protein
LLYDQASLICFCRLQLICIASKGQVSKEQLSVFSSEYLLSSCCKSNIFFGAGVCSNEQDRLVPALIELINLIVAKTNMKFLLVIQTLKKKAICY